MDPGINFNFHGTFTFHKKKHVIVEKVYLDFKMFFTLRKMWFFFGIITVKNPFWKIYFEECS